MIASTGLVGLSTALSHILFNINIDTSCVGIFLYAAAIFITGTKYPNSKVSNILLYIGENLSLYVYIYHLLIGNIILFLAKAILKVDIHTTWFTPVIIVITTIIFSYFTYKINAILLKQK